MQRIATLSEKLRNKKLLLTKPIHPIVMTTWQWEIPLYSTLQGQSVQKIFTPRIISKKRFDWKTLVLDLKLRVGWWIVHNLCYRWWKQKDPNSLKQRENDDFRRRKKRVKWVSQVQHNWRLVVTVVLREGNWLFFYILGTGNGAWLTMERESDYFRRREKEFNGWVESSTIGDL